MSQSSFVKYAAYAKHALLATATLGLLLLVTAGCSKSTVASAGIDAKSLAAHRARLTLAEEPDGVQTVAEVRLALLGEPGENHEDHDHDGDGIQDHAPADHAHATESMNVVMVGHIGGLANPWAEVQPEFPFAKARAVFFLADPRAIVENEESGHSHAPGEECSFCAAHAEDQADMLAMVQLVDEEGKVLPTDVRQLFDVKEKDTVVVSGKARVTAGGILVVDAQGIFVRK
ncbi:MAG: hypothetical protein GXP24_09085 [Planctomycetes bacterium]|nr:hypothetical protein [Planctomycetota bacterium]